ncbi:hypothetical protein ACFO0A_00350 [Novosphingobium tardum]|uniref:Uncharacterized protein n=1 Tax=Novosphingobium tardum TaxID=1538021 RepID=A0ABV8RLX2_9SPHN
MGHQVRQERWNTGPRTETFGVLVGWTHSPTPHGISLKLQSTESQQQLDRNEVDERHFLLTRNQALLVARYLLEATGQSLEQDSAVRGWRRWLSRRRH